MTTYTKHINNWLDFSKQKLEVAKRLYSNSSSENYTNRSTKIQNRRAMLELEYEKLNELSPVLEQISSFYATLRVKHMQPNSTDESLREEEEKFFASLDPHLEASLQDYLRELENLLSEQEGYSGRQSTKKGIIPPLWNRKSLVGSENEKAASV